MWTKAVFLVLLYVHICSASPDSKWETSDFLPVHNWYGVRLLTASVGHLFYTWTKAPRPSSQKALGNPDSFNMVVRCSDNTLLALSATPFWWGQALIVCCLLMPNCVVNYKNTLLMYSWKQAASEELNAHRSLDPKGRRSLAPSGYSRSSTM